MIWLVGGALVCMIGCGLVVWALLTDKDLPPAQPGPKHSQEARQGPTQRLGPRFDPPA